jgi:DNA-binding transcriptional ArsR family regulator
MLVVACERQAESLPRLVEPACLACVQHEIHQGLAQSRRVENRKGRIREATPAKHLGVLLEAGIVRRRKVGNYAYYSIADGPERGRGVVIITLVI